MTKSKYCQNIKVQITGEYLQINKIFFIPPNNPPPRPQPPQCPLYMLSPGPCWHTLIRYFNMFVYRLFLLYFPIQTLLRPNLDDQPEGDKLQAASYYYLLSGKVTRPLVKKKAVFWQAGGDTTAGL